MDSKNPWWVWALPLPAVWWTALAAAEVKASGGNLFDLLAKISAPSWPMWTENSAKFLLLFTLAYAVGVCAFLSSRKNYRRGVEHGSARWGEVQQITKRYMDKSPDQNLILTEHFRIGLDGYRHKRNLNVLVIGGSGAGKSRSYAVPNVLQCSCSMVVTDPKGEILRKTGNALKAHGYEIRVFDLINPATSFGYNPLAYLKDDKDVLKLIENLIQSTTPPGNHGGDPFWVKSETALLQALVLYLMHEAPAV